MTTCGNKKCDHEYDLHDVSGTCSFPGCDCRDFKYKDDSQKFDDVDKKARGFIAMFRRKKSTREQVEST